MILSALFGPSEIAAPVQKGVGRCFKDVLFDAVYNPY